MALPNCRLCNCALKYDVVTVRDKGIKKLESVSEIRGDSIFAKDENGTISLHVKCRAKYINEKCIQAALKKKSLDSENVQLDLGFDYQNKCFFCETDASDDYMLKEKKKSCRKRNIVSKVLRLDTRDNILQASFDNLDQWSQEVRDRVQGKDLVSLNSRYHRNCFAKFIIQRTKEGGKRGRPESTEIVEAMEQVYQFIDDNLEDSQFTLKKIRKALPHCSQLPDNRTIKRKLMQHYGENLIIIEGQGKESILCFVKTGEKILQKEWYQQKQTDEATERIRIVRTAANIILEDIRACPYETDCYPPPDNFLNNVNEMVPQTLNVFLHTIMTKYKKNPIDYKNQVTAVAHSIISAARPRSFKSPLLLGISSVIHHKYASKTLINLLSSLGFCASYKECVKLEISTTLHPQPQHEAEFQQFVFDNADFNTMTLDGLHTFHSMGGIVCKTPKISTQNLPVLRLSTIPPKEIIGIFGTKPLQQYEKGANGLLKVKIESHVTESSITPNLNDILWLFGKTSEFLKMPGWNSYMAKERKDEEYAMSEVTVMPFINHQPSDLNTVYTSLLTAVEANKTDNITIVTYDQPLYIKAQQIVHSVADPRFKYLFIRLGGFHLLMSFMGAIGYVMSGSGLKDLWCTIYAAVSTEKMLTGHSYARALRAHFLTRCALFNILINSVEISLEEKLKLEEVLDDDDFLKKEEKNELFVKFQSEINKCLDSLEERGPTAKLWVQYFKMITLIAHFIEAERSGNWHQHIATVKQMLPYLHASGHFAYAKCCQLYIQDAKKLETMMTAQQYDCFVRKGYFTIRRSDKFWCGVFSDQTIEQTLMRSMKSAGGLTRGRGLTDSVLAKWIQATPMFIKIAESVEEFCGTSFSSAEAHADSRDSRIKRDDNDVKKLGHWFASHDPFPSLGSLVSLSTGVVGGDNINCHEAAVIGKEMMMKKIGQNFGEVTYSRKDRVMPLSTVNSSINIHGSDTPIEPDTIFRRITFAKKNQEELKFFFTYELAPYPLSLFDESGMRKCTKSSLYDLATPIEESSLPTSISNLYVIDGGLLLHRVIWQKGLVASNICENYVLYVKKHFGTNSVVIFDGYDTKTTKAAERTRRSRGKTVADIILDDNTAITVSQEPFLSNENNKMRLINMLKDHFKEADIPTKQSSEDADVLIVTTAIQNANEYDNVFIVGNDIDLLVILCGSTTKTNVYLKKLGRGSVPTCYYSTKSFSNPAIKNNIMFIHAISGCDTTSAMFRQGKKKVANFIKNTPGIDEFLNVFKNPEAEPNSVVEAGEKLLCLLYGGSGTLAEIRYKSFAKSITKSQFNLACLPPTSDSATQHLLRVYHQIQKWSGNNLPPTNWGWKLVHQHYEPIRMTFAAAPKEILELISCKCKVSCSKNCTCKKAGIFCTAICPNCDGKVCHGVDYDSDEDLQFNDDCTPIPTTFVDVGDLANDNQSENDDLMVDLDSSSDYIEGINYKRIKL